MGYHIWTLIRWEKLYTPGKFRSGLRIRFDKGVDEEVKRAVKEFCMWLRREYHFPIRIPVYVKAKKKIAAMDGELVSATFFAPENRTEEPYIRVSAGDYEDLLARRGKDNALAAILRSIAHELTHYFQWINGLELTNRGMERQATNYSRYIVDEYAQTREHP